MIKEYTNGKYKTNLLTLYDSDFTSCNNKIKVTCLRW